MKAEDAAEVADELERDLGLDLGPAARNRLSAVHRPRWNIAPGSDQWVLIGGPRPLVARWGIVTGGGGIAINARAESLTDRSTFCVAADRGRAVIVADGFYEWDRKGSPERNPWWFSPIRGGLLLFAAVCRKLPDGYPKFAIITTEPNHEVRAIHDRMPAVLDAATAHAWLAPGPADRVTKYLRPAPDGSLIGRAVSRWANDPAHDGPRCLAPPEGPPEQGDLFR